VLACDVNKEWTDKAQEYWHQAGVRHKVPACQHTLIKILRVSFKRKQIRTEAVSVVIRFFRLGTGNRVVI
jgi:hypothetical protein